jgi:hypothetical protein
MSTLLLFAAFLALVLGVAHSVLGERYILIRLFRRTDLPHLFGSPEFTIRTLRFAWHITSIAWWGFAALLILLARDAVSSHTVALVLAATSLVSCAISMTMSRGRHLSWLAFLTIGVVALYAAVT